MFFFWSFWRFEGAIPTSCFMLSSSLTGDEVGRLYLEVIYCLPGDLGGLRMITVFGGLINGEFVHLLSRLVLVSATLYMGGT